MAKQKQILLDKVKIPTSLCAELNLFGGKRAFQLVVSMLDYGFKGVEPQKGDLDEQQTKYYLEVIKPIIDKQKAEKKRKLMRKRYFANAAKRNRSTTTNETK